MAVRYGKLIHSESGGSAFTSATIRFAEYSIWLLTGSWCSDPDLIIAATDRYDRQVECWWDCVVTTNKCACTCAANVIAASCTLGFTHIEVARQPFGGGMGAGGPITTLQSRLALWIGEWVIQDGYNDGREPGRIT